MSVRMEKDVVVGSAGGRDLLADVYHPEGGATKRTAVIVIHGGGFRGGNKDMKSENARLFAERGYVAISAQYRLAGEAKWPAPVEDIKTLIRWTRSNAGSLGIDADKIATCGHSAGAALSLIVSGSAGEASLEGSGGSAGAGSEIAAAVAYYPPVRMGKAPDGNDAPIMTPGSSEEDYRKASSVTYAREGATPTLLFHGTSDALVNFAASQELFEALQKAGIPAELHLIQGADHEFDRELELAEITVAVADLFIDRHVSNKREYAPFRVPAPAGAPAPGH